MSTKTQFPITKWAQRKNCLYITINVVHTTKPNIDIIDGKKLKYSGTDGVNNYAFEIELFDEVLKEESKYTLDARNIFLNIKKKTAGPYWDRLTKESIKYQWLQVDWAYFVDEDEEEEAATPNFDGMNFGDADEMDEDDEPPKGEEHEHCGCGHDHEEHHHDEEKKEEEKKPDLSDLDKEESK